jgi:hypothetical protein
MRGGSGLLSGWRGSFFRHHCGGFISLPGQICRFPTEYTSWLSIKYDYHIKYYSGRFNTYRLDRTTVTVGAPRMLVMSTSLASAGHPPALLWSLPFLLALHLRQEFFDSGGWATTPSGLPHRVHSPSSPCSTGSIGGNSCKQGNFIVNMRTRDISTRLHYSRRLTSWDVVSVTFNLLVTRFQTTLRGLLGGAGRLASRLVG